MPVFDVCESEKDAIRSYLREPAIYLNAVVASKILIDGIQLPQGTKVTRDKHIPAFPHTTRFYIIPSVNGEAERIIPILKIMPEDPKLHSATLLEGQIYFHQNKSDLPLLLPENFDDICDFDDSDSDDDTPLTEQEKDKIRTGWMKALGKPNYTLYMNQLGFFKRVVKFAMDENGNHFYLKSESSFQEDVVSPQNHPEILAPHLYAGPPLLRRKIMDSLKENKRINFTKNAGEDLLSYMGSGGSILPDIKREQLSIAIAKAYLTQISNKGIIHTDIKPSNICVNCTESDEEPYEINFIDFEESFITPNLVNSIRGSIPYLAPEFFKTRAGFNNRFKNFNDDTSLNENYQTFFCRASDLFALGQTLLRDVKPPKNSLVYRVARSLMSSEKECRFEAEKELNFENISLYNSPRV